MFSEENIEIDVCNEDLIADPKDVAQEEYHQDQCISEHRTPNYLTASELFNLRRDVCKNKGKDEDVEVYKGPKHYVPSDVSQDEETMKGILQSHKKSLSLQRGAKIRDCMKAEWDEELKVAIVAHLKGKVTQHMGRNFKGKVALSPEEALYLLEKNCIEIKRNNMPMSIEEAYTVMLKGKLGLEKYQVYSHLSQQGFLVVQHQTRVGSKFEEIANAKQNQKKRKAVNGSTGEPLEKRLTFSGVLASNAIENVNVITEGSALSSECELLNSSDSFNKSSLVPEDTINLNTDKVSNSLPDLSEIAKMVSTEDNAVTADSANHVDFVEKDLLQSPLVSVCTNKESSVDNVDDLLNTSNLPVIPVENEKQSLSEVEPCIEMSLQLNEPEVSCKEQDNEDAIKICNDNIHKTGDNKNESDHTEDATAVNKNGTKVQDVNDDTNDVIIEGEHKSEKANEINVDDSFSDYDAEDFTNVTDESLPAVCEESSEDLDVLSCSTGEQPSMFDGLKSISSSEIFERTVKEHDDEVTLVEVKKKESMPLAVIDLLSDEEENVEKSHLEEMFEGSDDDIQVVKVCPATRNNAQSSSRNFNSIKAECKAERSVIKSSAEIKSAFRPQMKLPDMFRKEVLCLSRPPVTLLPNNVRPAKEVYVINHKNTPKPRLWNSFRDMEDYQRDRRLQRQSNNSNSSRSFNSLRDYRFHNDLHTQRMNSFNREENAMDSNFERNNQNLAFGQSRNSFNSPVSMSHEPSSGLLPSPAVFNSSNHMPFMNIPNMHNLSSSNPASIVNEIQRTVHSVASSILTTMLGQHMNHMNPAAGSSPTFNEPPMMSHNSHHFNNFSATSPMISEHPQFNAMRSDFHPVRFPTEPMFQEERVPYSMHRERMYDSPFAQNSYRQRNFERKGPLFPRAYRQAHRKRCWNDIKSTAKDSNAKESDSGSDIEEVPINLNQFLWSNDIQPLVKPGSKLPASEVLQKLRITQMANLLDVKKNNDRYLPNPPGLEISFDVYLPGFKYKKTAPDVPKQRIVILRSVDPIPKYSEIVVLQRKWNDGAMLQMAVVDHGDISFYSFNSVVLPDLIPHES